MLKLEFDPANKALAAAIGRALTAYAEASRELRSPAHYATAAPVEEGYRAVAEASRELRSPEQEKSLAELAERVEREPVTQAPTVEHAAVEATKHGAAPEVDEKGVAKDPNFCGTAAVPFYASGKRAGQWKKRQGVDDAVYDAWYEAALSRVASKPKAEPEAISTAAAFGKPEVQTPAAPAAKQFGNAGEFMAWVSEQQTAGHLQQSDIDRAYAETGVAVQDLFNPQLAGKAIAAVYAALRGE